MVMRCPHCQATDCVEVFGSPVDDREECGCVLCRQFWTQRTWSDEYDDLDVQPSLRTSEWEVLLAQLVEPKWWTCRDRYRPPPDGVLHEVSGELDEMREACVRAGCNVLYKCGGVWRMGRYEFALTEADFFVAMDFRTEVHVYDDGSHTARAPALSRCVCGGIFMGECREEWCDNCALWVHVRCRCCDARRAKKKSRRDLTNKA